MSTLALVFNETLSGVIPRLTEELEINAHKCVDNSGDEEVETRIKQADTVLLCVDSGFLESEKCTKETFLSHGFGKKCIVLYFEQLDMEKVGGTSSAIISSLDHIDFYDHHNKVEENNHLPAESLRKLMDKLGKQGKKESARPKTREKPPMVRSAYRSSNSAFHIAFLCAPDKLKIANAIAKGLESYGYSYKVIDFVAGSVSTLPKFKVAIVCLSDRFVKSTQGTGEVIRCANMNRPILTLILEANIKWPPKNGANFVFRRHRPIECSALKTEADWRGETKEMKAIIAELEYLIPEVKPKRFQRRVRSASPRRDRNYLAGSPSSSINLPPINKNRASSYPRQRTNSRYRRPPTTRQTFGTGPDRPITAASFASVRSRYRQPSATERNFDEVSYAPRKLPSAYRKGRTSVY